jgi:hypothetical protein
LTNIFSARVKLLAIEDWIFNERNLLICGFGIAWVWFVPVGTLLFGGGENSRLLSMDFCWMWVSGKLAASSDPSLIYSPAAFTEALRTLLGTDRCHFLHFSYPPTILFFTYPLGLLPYIPAFLVWMVATLALYLAAVYTIVPRPAAVIAALTPLAVPLNVLLGHNGFLTAGLIGWSLILVERWPWLCGMVVGLLSYKPHFGILFPFVFLASRNWRVLASAAAMSTFLGVAAGFEFGYQAWESFINLLHERNSALSTDGVILVLQSVYGSLDWAGATIWFSWTVHLTVALLVTIAICVVWTSRIPRNLKASILCVGVVTVTPYALQYDLCILSIAVALFVKDGLSSGFLPGERTAVLICLAALLLWFAEIRIGPVVYGVLLLLIARRIAVYPSRELTERKDDAALDAAPIPETL